MLSPKWLLVWLGLRLVHTAHACCSTRAWGWGAKVQNNANIHAIMFFRVPLGNIDPFAMFQASCDREIVIWVIRIAESLSKYGVWFAPQEAFFSAPHQYTQVGTPLLSVPGSCSVLGWSNLIPILSTLAMPLCRSLGLLCSLGRVLCMEVDAHLMTKMREKMREKGDKAFLITVLSTYCATIAVRAESWTGSLTATSGTARYVDQRRDSPSTNHFRTSKQRSVIDTLKTRRSPPRNVQWCPIKASIFDNIMENTRHFVILSEIFTRRKWRKSANSANPTHLTLWAES